MCAKVGILGRGIIGKELAEKCRKKHDLIFVSDSKKLFFQNGTTASLTTLREHLRSIDLLFLAIPSVGLGEVAKNYILSSLYYGVPVVTCEKGALSEFFTDLKPHIDRIGFNATVGGGTRMLSFVKDKLREVSLAKISGIHVVLNGTLNFLMYRLSEGKKLEEAIEEAQDRGYAEPGETDVARIINQEIYEDTIRKTVILLNTLNIIGTPLSFNQLSENSRGELNVEVLKELEENPSTYRYIVSISREEIAAQKRAIGGFEAVFNEWYVSGGFVRVDLNKIYKDYLVLSGVLNSLVLEISSQNIKSVIGEGAGPGPTTNAMMKDAELLLKQRNRTTHHENLSRASTNTG